MTFKVKIISLISALIAFLYFDAYIESYKYNEGNETATAGIVFTQTIIMAEYRVIGSGNNLLGKYDIVTRSAMQESIVVYHRLWW